jgi:hypothetical protein
LLDAEEVRHEAEPPVAARTRQAFQSERPHQLGPLIRTGQGRLFFAKTADSRLAPSGMIGAADGNQRSSR